MKWERWSPLWLNITATNQLLLWWVFACFILRLFVDLTVPGFVHNSIRLRQSELSRVLIQHLYEGVSLSFVWNLLAKLSCVQSSYTINVDGSKFMIARLIKSTPLSSQQLLVHLSAKPHSRLQYIWCVNPATCRRLAAVA